MRVLVTLEDHLRRSADGHYYVDGPAHYAAWSQLLGTFDEVALLARVERRNDHTTEEHPVDGRSVSIYELPDYVGPAQYLVRLPVMQPIVRRAVAECDASILRVPGLVGRLAWQEVRRLNKRYSVEVLGDPWDAFGPGTMPSFFRPGYRQIASRNMKAICRDAVAALYWNESVLPRRYPSRRDSFSAVSPLLNFPNGDVVEPSRSAGDRLSSERSGSAKTLGVGFVGSFAQLYKGPDTLLRAVSLCSRRGLLFRLLLVGDGRYRPTMERLAHRLSIRHNVSFLGQLKHSKAIFDFLDSIDLFAMPSRAEGFPRALHEAMARGCPCIGSNVGGIPELLAADDLVPPNDPEALARKIMEVAANPERMKEMSVRNFARAKQFDPEVLRDKRRAFYEQVRLRSEGAGNSTSR